MPVSWAFPALAALLVLVHWGLSWEFIHAAAPTYDEPFHLASGYNYLKTGDLEADMKESPPFAQIWEVLPLYLSRPSLAPSYRDKRWGNSQWEAEVGFVRLLKGEFKELLNRCRVFGLATWSLLGLLALGFWARDLGGGEAALGAIFFYALDPEHLAHNGLTTTDAASSTLFFASAFLACRVFKEKEPSLPWAVLAGAAAGAAVGTKYNMVALPAFLLVTQLWDRRGEPWWGLERCVPAWLAFAGGALAVLLSIYGFRLPLYWEGMNTAFEWFAGQHNLRLGKTFFFMGEVSQKGWFTYFPTVILIKAPLPFLILGLAGLFLQPNRNRARGAAWAVLPMAAYFAAAMNTKIQQGYRYLLPMIPFLELWAGVAAARLWALRGKARLGVGLLALWQVLSVLHCRPYYLSYFNESIGGPSRGWRYVVDSNVDWGQGLSDLGRELREMGDPPIYLSYFGTADPAVYGIRYLPVFCLDSDIVRDASPFHPVRSGRVLVAISATNLQGPYLFPHDAWAWLKSRKPLKEIAYSIFLYDLSDDPEGLRNFARNLAAGLYDPRLPAEAEEVRRYAEKKFPVRQGEFREAARRGRDLFGVEALTFRGARAKT